MKYTIWLHLHGRGAQTCALIAGYPLRQSDGWDNETKQTKYSELGSNHQIKVELTAKSDDMAWYQLNQWLKVNQPNERRPIQGKSYLRECRESLRQRKTS